MFFKSLRREVLALTLGLTGLTIVITAILGAHSTLTAGNDAQRATNSTLRDQAGETLTQITQASAERLDILFERTRNDTANVAAYAKNIYENPFVFSGQYWNYDNKVFKVDGRYLNSTSDVSTVFIPNYTIVDQREKARINVSAYLDFIAPSILERNPDSVAVYTIDPKGFSRYYPNIVLGSVAPPNHSTLDDVVYKQGTPEEDPEKEVKWSPLYDDPAERGLMITATAPIYTKNGFEGTIGIDILLNNIIKNITSFSPIQGSYAFLIDKNGDTIAFPDQAYRDILGRSRNEGEVRTSLATTTSPGFGTILEKMKNGGEGFGSMHNGTKELFIAYAPLKQTGFSMAIAVDAAVMLRAAQTLNTQISGSVQNNIMTRILPAAVLVILLASIAGVLLVNRIVKPIQELTIGAREIGKGNFDYIIKTHSKNEIGELSTTFNEMAKDLKKSHQELFEYSQGLEIKVAERTQELSNANMAQENLLHFISHEIKGYLTKSEAGFAGIVEGDFGPVTQGLQMMSSAALTEVRKGVATIMDILDASNLKKGTISYAKKPFDFGKAVRAVVHELAATAQERGLVLKFNPTSILLTVSGDEDKIVKHVIRNVIDNSIKYTKRGSVVVSLSKEGTLVQMLVEDTGVGITSEDMAHLFTEGGHGKDSIKINVHSTGYGLFIAKQIVEAHGGKIWAESEGAGKGAQFIVQFPTA